MFAHFTGVMENRRQCGELKTKLESQTPVKNPILYAL